mgnify:CR=1 FL=1
MAERGTARSRHAFLLFPLSFAYAQQLPRFTVAPFGAVQTRRTVPYPFAERSFQWGYGGCRGPKGRNRNLPWPPCKKGYKGTPFSFVYLNPSVKPSVCQPSLLRRATLVGTRSPYSLPFVILPVPARSPFRFIRHRRRSTPNPVNGDSFWLATIHPRRNKKTPALADAFLWYTLRGSNPGHPD